MNTDWAFKVPLVAALLAASLLVGGCGDSSGSNEDSVQAQIDEARREGAVAAHRQERMAELQRRVARLERRSRNGAAGAPAGAPPVTETSDTSGGSSILRLFRTPSGNVACAILSDGATCSVTSADLTFVLESGVPAWTESGVAFPGESGEPAPYGATIGVGGVSCSIPAADEQRGVTCTDSGSGHGFEASRVGSRQRVF